MHEKQIASVPTRLHLFTTKYLGPVVERLASRGFNPDWLSWSGLALAVAAGGFLAFGIFLPALILGLLSSLTDMADGLLARMLDEKNRRSELQIKRGQMVDPFVDRHADAALWLGILIYVLPAFIQLSELNWLHWIALFMVILSYPFNLASSWIRAKVEGVGLTLGEKKPLTRTVFLILLGGSCIIALLITEPILDMPILFWCVAVIGLVQGITWLQRFIRAPRASLPQE
ncbi:CDP-alcohol phosphatidyltransferase family protein [Patescibacteria group bacterium]|nr:CDP-alcohol phosphatidyltransferase family protein [Patescibacteria group bacterium]MBU0963802.1 CDP-alcohol phosphatidyltransferase family protein [Patescibacteria group bacterium]